MILYNNVTRYKGVPVRLFLIMLSFISFISFASAETKEIILTKDNTLVLNQAFSGKSVSSLMGEAKKLDANLKSGYPIYLFLNTPGGSVQAGLELIEFFKGVNRPVHTVTLFAASMGFQLVQNLGKRYILEHGVLMSHKASGGFRGEFGGGGSQLDSRYTMWLRRLNILDSKTVSRTNGKKTLKQYQADYDNELWLNGSEAVVNGYADEVASIKCSSGLNGSEVKTFRSRGFSLNVEFSNCPIITSPISVKMNVRTNDGYMDLDVFMDKGGKFGKDCRLKTTAAPKDWRGEDVKPLEKELCLMDTTLTLEKLDKAIDEKRSEITSRTSKVLKMSFGSFLRDL